MPASAILEEWFAETYHFPPAITRELDLDSLEWFQIIRQAKAEVQRMRDREAEREARSQQRR